MDAEPNDAWIERSLLRAAPPADPAATASGFADWVYRITVPERARSLDGSHKEQRASRKREGVFGHSELDLFFRTHGSSVHGLNPSGWKLLFSDTHDGSSPSFAASRLSVGGRTLRGVPDAVLTHSGSNTVLIIERKFTFVPEHNVPSNGWPSLQAQLWSYSWMDDWLDARSVLLVGQLWQVRDKSGSGRWKPRYRQLFRRSPRYTRDDPDFDRRWRSIFERYGGQVAGRALSGRHPEQQGAKES